MNFIFWQNKSISNVFHCWARLIVASVHQNKLYLWQRLYFIMGGSETVDSTLFVISSYFKLTVGCPHRPTAVGRTLQSRPSCGSDTETVWWNEINEIINILYQTDQLQLVATHKDNNMIGGFPCAIKTKTKRNWLIMMKSNNQPLCLNYQSLNHS